MSKYYVGLDIGQGSTAICIIDDEGKIICEGIANSKPEEIYGWLNKRIELNEDIHIALEAGNLSTWFYRGLTEFGLKATCLETFQAHRFLATFRNKTDRNDARGLAQLIRMGGEDFLKVVKIRSQVAQETRVLLSMRNHLVKQKVSLENHIAGILKPFGIIIERSGVIAKTYRNRVLEGLREANTLGVHLMGVVIPSLDLYMEICKKIEPLTKKVETIVDETEMAKRFTEIPGVGPITALSFYSAIDDPTRFMKSRDVAAYLGLTPRQHQSGETDFTTGISRRGDPATRRALVSAATVLLTNTRQWTTLKAWGIRLAKRIGFSKARIAVARKLAIIMHKM